MFFVLFLGHVGILAVGASQRPRRLPETPKRVNAPRPTRAGPQQLEDIIAGAAFAGARKTCAKHGRA